MTEFLGYWLLTSIVVALFLGPAIKHHTNAHYPVEDDRETLD